MASAAPITARSRKGLKLSSIHAGKRSYPKSRPPDLQLPQSSAFAALFTPSSPDILPEYTSPTSPKFHRSRVSLSSLSLPWNGFPIAQSRAFWVVLCFSLNFSLTLCNKVVLNRLPLPYTMTAFHALAGWIGTGFILRHEDRAPALSRSQSIVLVFFSVLYTLNIVVSNASLRLVTVPFHQVVRSSSPFFTLALSNLLLQTRITHRKAISLVPVAVGVSLATYGDYYFTLSGFLLTLFGTFLASLKGVVTNVLQSLHSHPRTLPSPHQEPSLPYLPSPHSRVRSSIDHDSISIASSSPSSPQQQSRKTIATLLSSIPKLNLTPFQLLYLLSPLAFVQCSILALYFGEFNKIISEVAQLRQLSASVTLSGNRLNITFSEAMLNGSGAGAGHAGISADAHASGLISPTSLMLLRSLAGLAVNAFMAFALNVVSFHTNRKVGALAMSVAANIKQVLTILSSVLLFNLTITKMNTLGVLLTLIGGAWYARVDLEERQKIRR